MKFGTEKAKMLVRKYMDTIIGDIFQQDYSIFIVWHAYILGNEKWMLVTSLRDNFYFEVTYNRDKDVFYFDVYHKNEHKEYKHSIEGHLTDITNKPKPKEIK